MNFLYFIAVRPPESLNEKIRAIQKDFADNYEAVKAYHSFPHITIVQPSHSDNEADVLNSFKNVKTIVSPFEVYLKGFDFFDREKGPVVFIKPEEQPALQQLKLDFETVSTAKPIPFYHPHLTVAFRDLSYQNFIKAREVYQQKIFEASFRVDSIGLYKHFDKKWNERATLYL